MTSSIRYAAVPPLVADGVYSLRHRLKSTVVAAVAPPATPAAEEGAVGWGGGGGGGAIVAEADPNGRWGRSNKGRLPPLTLLLLVLL